MVGFSPRVPSKSSPREPTLAGDSELRARRKRSDPAERLSHGQSRRISPTAVRMIASAIELVSQLPVQWRRRGCAFVRQLRPAPWAWPPLVAVFLEACRACFDSDPLETRTTVLESSNPVAFTRLHYLG